MLRHGIVWYVMYEFAYTHARTNECMVAHNCESVRLFEYSSVSLVTFIVCTFLGGSPQKRARSVGSFSVKQLATTVQRECSNTVRNDPKLVEGLL